MNFKRFLPAIVLSVVSLFVFLCALGAVYLVSVDAITRQMGQSAFWGLHP
jgi:cell division protein FtsB